MRATEWNRHVGGLWAELLRSSLPRVGSVVEIGPGFSDKIGLALARLRFSGTLYVVEPTGDALRHTLARYAELLPEARIEPVPRPLQHATERLPRECHAVLMNHVLDDMLLHDALPDEDSQRLFRTMRGGLASPGRTRGAWHGVLTQRRQVLASRRRVATSVRRLIGHTRPRFVGLSQYDSWTLKRLGLCEVNRLAGDLLKDIGRPYGRVPAAHQATLRAFGQDPDRWLIREGRELLPALHDS
jgi:uncharacterized protein YjiS (DUF1127 family)